jgi:hypothetical protein
MMGRPNLRAANSGDFSIQEKLRSQKTIKPYRQPTQVGR